MARLQRKHFEGLIWRRMTSEEAVVGSGARGIMTEKRQGHFKKAGFSVLSVSLWHFGDAEVKI